MDTRFPTPVGQAFDRTGGSRWPLYRGSGDVDEGSC